jgi:transposase
MSSNSAINQYYGVLVRLRYNYRLYPDTASREALARSFGCARVVFNDGLRLRQEARANGEKYLSDGELSARRRLLGSPAREDRAGRQSSRHQARSRWFHQCTRLNRDYALVN